VEEPNRVGGRPGTDATILPPRDARRRFIRPWPPLIEMDEALKAKVERLLKLWQRTSFLSNFLAVHSYEITR